MRCNTRDTISSMTSSVITGATGRAAASAFAADKFANGFVLSFVAAGLSTVAVGEVGATVGLSTEGVCEGGAKVDAIGLSTEAV